MPGTITDGSVRYVRASTLRRGRDMARKTPSTTQGNAKPTFARGLCIKSGARLGRVPSCLAATLELLGNATARGQLLGRASSAA